MGIAWLLLRRTFKSRPKRTLLFLLGYALATTVMITLLSVGQAVLIQAQDKDLLGGGDLILVPKGVDVESLKMGGISALYFTIPQARFIVRQLLQSNRFHNEISAVSPYLFSKLLYARKAGARTTSTPVFASGSIPDQENKVKGIELPWRNRSEDNEWLKPDPSRFYHEIDRFHLPTVESSELDRWAEWHYFNFESTEFRGYLSFMLVGNVLKDKANWVISLQMFHDHQYHRYSVTFPAHLSQIPVKTVDYRVGTSRVRFLQDHYEIQLDFQDKLHIHGSLSYYPEPGLYFPPTYLARSTQFESGYVIPSVRGTYQGTLTVGGKEFHFDDVTGYHDHNWGIWQQIQWNWGHLYSDQYALFFGEIFLNAKSKGLFVAVFDRHGFLTVLRPQGILFSDYQNRPEGIRVPLGLRIESRKAFASLNLIGKATSLTSTTVDANKSIYFIQYAMKYSVSLELDGKRISFPGIGNAETYVER